MKNRLVVLALSLFASLAGSEPVSAERGAPSNEEIRRCSIESGWPGNVNVKASIEQQAGVGPQYAFRYECNYIPGISRSKRCANGGNPFPYEGGHLEPPSPGNEFEYMSECKKAVVVCCKPRS
jgi:hypothetical protein